MELTLHVKGLKSLMVISLGPQINAYDQQMGLILYVTLTHDEAFPAPYSNQNVMIGAHKTVVPSLIV